MNAEVRAFAKSAAKKSRTIIGLMSGTSFDGLDVALCKITGSGKQTKVDLLKFETVAYSEEIKKRILTVFAKKQILFHDLVMLNPWIGVLHGNMVLQCLKKWKISPAKIDCIASHGQTVFHAPQFLFPNSDLNSTLQVGDGDHLAVTTGITTLSDFRQKHIAAGGEGAPLAVYGDFLLFSKKGENRILLNMGGIANFTFLPSSGDAGKVFVTDTGPGNTLLDQAARKYFQRDCDLDAALAMQGHVNRALLDSLKSNPFFRLPFPKTIGPELFNLDYIKDALAKSGADDVSHHDILATLTQFSADTIVEAILSVTMKKKDFKIFFSGGGAHNPLLMTSIKRQLPHFSFEPMANLGINGDAKEAVLFAVLANETLAGGRANFGSRSKVPSVSLGKISFAK